MMTDDTLLLLQPYVTQIILFLMVDPLSEIRQVRPLNFYRHEMIKVLLASQFHGWSLHKRVWRSPFHQGLSDFT